MPADIHTFNMLEQGVLEGLTVDELSDELFRVPKMEESVAKYCDLINLVMRKKLDEK